MSYNEQEYDKFEKRMMEKFPKMFSQSYGGFAIGKGWWPIVESLCANIQHYLDWTNKNHTTYPVVEQVVVGQVKEKLGGLRFYYDGGDSKIDGMVQMAESWAARHCEDCGNPGKSRTGGWIRTLCDHHNEEYQARLKERG